MSKVKVDQSILQKEIDKLLAGITQYRAMFLQASRERMSTEFQAKTWAVDMLVRNFADSLKPVRGFSSVQILNANYDTMRHAPVNNEFRKQNDTKDFYRYVDLLEATYEHQPVKGFMGDQDGIKVAKQALHDYLDCAVLYYHSIIELSFGDAVADAVMLKSFVEKGHEYIREAPPNILPFPPAPRRK